MGGREVREGILGDQGNRSGKQTDEEEREEEREGGRSGFLWQMGCETNRGARISAQWALECVHLSSPAHARQL